MDQGDQFPGNPFHLIRVPADQGDQFPGNPFHSQGMNANATPCA